ncbi:MAG TPA: hypothetical protein VJB12_02575 [Candidatus Nanoarchaeia archaeon]|nr:hypothetical protein [Candidatus Nanoarchaeia archaeon]
MKEQTLLRLALMASIIGLAILFLISDNPSLQITPIGSIDSSMKGNQVSIIGSVESVRQAGEFQVLTISQPSSIEVFVPASTSVRNGDVVEVLGRVDEYNKEREIIADRIRTIS